MATYEDEEATTEEKLDIINHYLSQSPPGQFYEVLKGKCLSCTVTQC